MDPLCLAALLGNRRDSAQLLQFGRVLESVPVSIESNRQSRRKCLAGTGEASKQRSVLV